MNKLLEYSTRPRLIARCFVEIDDDSIQAVFRIDFAVEFADEFFIGAGDGKFMAAWRTALFFG